MASDDRRDLARDLTRVPRGPRMAMALGSQRAGIILPLGAVKDSGIAETKRGRGQGDLCSQVFSNLQPAELPLLIRDAGHSVEGVIELKDTPEVARYERFRGPKRTSSHPQGSSYKPAIAELLAKVLDHVASFAHLNICQIAN